ncbi:MAG: Lrp/AsnC family transcriptional regulator [Bacteroidetes bacterium]|nr:Lrp/AsnC family transcriptional regulator [Bacteroidota bacterium]
MNGHKLDEIDIKILNVLQGNARTSYSKIAEQVNMSHTPVMERIHKMERAGVIQNYLATLDRQKIGKPVLVILSLKIDPQNETTLREFESAMKLLPEVQQMWVVSGNWNFVLHVSAKAPQDYFVFLMEKISILPFVGQTESAFVLRDSKAYTPYILDAKSL